MGARRPVSTGSAHDPLETRFRLRGAEAADEFARWRELPPRLHPVEPAPLPSDVARLLHRLRLRYFREAGPAVLARARDEGWDYADVLKVSWPRRPRGGTGPPASCTASRLACRRARHLTPGIRRPRRSLVTPSGRCGRSTGSDGPRTSSWSDLLGPASRTSPRRSPMPPSIVTCGSAGSASKA